MRFTRKTLTVTACGLLSLAACLPHVDWPVVSNADAQCPVPAKSRTMKKAELFTELSRAKIKAILAEPIPDVRFDQLPLREVLVGLKELTGINFYFDAEELGDLIDPDLPIVVNVAANSMTYKTLIEEFILEPNDLVIVIRDNHLNVMSYEKSLTEYEVVVYDCRDLLAAMSANATKRDDGGGGHESTTGLVSEGGLGATASAPERQLIEVIYSKVIHEDSPWDDGGAYSGVKDPYVGTISAVNGLLVVRQTQAVHEQVEHLLNLLRSATQNRN